jgi:hypothetical protein
MKPGRQRCSPPPVPLPGPSGNPWSSTSFASPAMSCTAIPAPASGAAPPRSHIMSPTLPSRRTAPQPRSVAIGTSRISCTTHATSRSRKINPNSAQPRYLRAAALLRLQYPAPQSDFNVQPGSLRCRSCRTRRAVQVELQLRALNSPASGCHPDTLSPVASNANGRDRCLAARCDLSILTQVKVAGRGSGHAAMMDRGTRSGGLP